MSGEQLSLDSPFFCINCEVKGFSSQELNIFLHFNSTSLTEAGGVKEAAGLDLLWGKGAQSLAMLWFGA